MPGTGSHIVRLAATRRLRARRKCRQFRHEGFISRGIGIVAATSSGPRRPADLARNGWRRQDTDARRMAQLATCPPVARRRPRHHAKRSQVINSRVEDVNQPTDLRDRLARLARAAVGPVVRGLVRLGVTANLLTAIGLVTSLAAAWLIVERHWTTAGVVFAAGSVMDMLDGSVARLTGTASPVGAFLDSTADRVADGAVLGAIAWSMAQQGQDLGLAASMVALVASLLVPYTRARAEGLGIQTNTGGLMSRPERIVVLAVGIFLGPHDRVLAILLVVLATLTAVTVVQRVAHVCKALRARA